MNRTVIITICLLATAFANGIMAQGVDENQMDQEIEIMESILDQLFFHNNENRSLGGKVSGNYLPGFGLIFKIPRYENYVLGQKASDNVYAVIADKNSQLIIGQNALTKEKMDSVREAGNAYFNETIRSFFIDYGDLISQLGANDHILVVFESGINSPPGGFVNNRFLWRRSNGQSAEEIGTSSKITAQVSYNDILNFKRGKTSENQFMQNIRFSEKSADEAVGREFTILAGIFTKLYGHHGGSFGNDPGVGFEIIDGLGVIYEMSLGHVLPSGQWRVSTITVEPEDEGKAKGKGKGHGRVHVLPGDYDKKVNDFKQQQQEAYLELKQKLKENLIRYGKTLKNLENDEILMLATKLSNCLGCNQPEKLNLIVKASVLKEFDQQKITLEQAVAQITEKEIEGTKKW